MTAPYPLRNQRPPPVSGRVLADARRRLNRRRRRHQLAVAAALAAGILIGRKTAR